jgi:hypothetical protein
MAVCFPKACSDNGMASLGLFFFLFPTIFKIFCDVFTKIAVRRYDVRPLASSAAKTRKRQAIYAWLA